MDNLPNRKQLRLKGYDYSQNGYYFVTICTKNKGGVLGNIKDNSMILNDVGLVVEKWWNSLRDKYADIKLWEYVVMPNHLHGIVEIKKADGPSFPLHEATELKNTVGAGFPRPQHDRGRGDRAPTLGNIIGYYKYQSTKDCRLSGLVDGLGLWQRNYFEHIIRDDKELQDIRKYIADNPANWMKDKLYF